jgi:heme/copper-type cytochrome/quinol oxidase subunit 4
VEICGSKQEEKNRRMDKMVEVMWGFVLSCCFTPNVITVIKGRRKSWERHLTFVLKVRCTYIVFCVTREEKALAEMLRQRLMPK